MWSVIHLGQVVQQHSSGRNTWWSPQGMWVLVIWHLQLYIHWHPIMLQSFITWPFPHSTSTRWSSFKKQHHPPSSFLQYCFYGHHPNMSCLVQVLVLLLIPPHPKGDFIRLIEDPFTMVWDIYVPSQVQLPPPLGEFHSSHLFSPLQGSGLTWSVHLLLLERLLIYNMLLFLFIDGSWNWCMAQLHRQSVLKGSSSYI